VKVEEGLDDVALLRVVEEVLDDLLDEENGRDLQESWPGGGFQIN